jgi:signal peptidase I
MPALIGRVFLLTVTLLGVLSGVAAVVLDIGVVPVLSPSMRPAFTEGDLLVTRSVATARLRVGDVVLLAPPDEPWRPFAHRLIQVDHRVDGAVVRTRGDANPSPDPQALVIAAPRTEVAIGHIPALGQVVLTAGRDRPRSLIRIAIVVLIAIGALRAVRAVRHARWVPRGRRGDRTPRPSCPQTNGRPAARMP